MQTTARLFALWVAVVPVVAVAAPEFSKGGLVFGLQYGVGLWGLDRNHLADQVGPAEADTYLRDVQNSHTASLRLGYNILGHVTLEGDLTATGWSLGDVNRGGAGFLAGVLHWHPMELIWRKQERPLPIDASLFFGYGAGLGGQNRGMGGPNTEFGVLADYFLGDSVALGLFARGIFLNWDTYYLNYDAKQSVPLPKGSGGAFWTVGLSLDFRIPLGS